MVHEVVIARRLSARLVRWHDSGGLGTADFLEWGCPSKADPLDQPNVTHPERLVPPALRAWDELLALGVCRRRAALCAVRWAASAERADHTTACPGVHADVARAAVRGAAGASGEALWRETAWGPAEAVGGVGWQRSPGLLGREGCFELPTRTRRSWSGWIAQFVRAL